MIQLQKEVKMYKFNKIDKDTCELEYNGEKHIIKRDLEKVVALQEIDFDARVLMNKKLKEMGASIEDLEYTKKVGEKTIVDDSQAQQVLEICKKEASYNKAKKLIQEVTGLSIYDIAMDLGSKEFETFVKDFISALIGETEAKPSVK